MGVHQTQGFGHSNIFTLPPPASQHVEGPSSTRQQVSRSLARSTTLTATGSATSCRLFAHCACWRPPIPPPFPPPGRERVALRPTTRATERERGKGQLGLRQMLRPGRRLRPRARPSESDAVDVTIGIAIVGGAIPCPRPDSARPRRRPLDVARWSYETRAPPRRWTQPPALEDGDAEFWLCPVWRLLLTHSPCLGSEVWRLFVQGLHQ